MKTYDIFKMHTIIKVSNAAWLGIKEYEANGKQRGKKIPFNTPGLLFLPSLPASTLIFQPDPFHTFVVSPSHSGKERGNEHFEV